MQKLSRVIPNLFYLATKRGRKSYQISFNFARKKLQGIEITPGHDDSYPVYEICLKNFRSDDD
jgi:hypothetical protein